MTAAVPPPPLVKPLLRGVSHQIAFYVSLAAGGALTAMTPRGVPMAAVAVYSVCLVALFGISSAYHRPTWSPAARQRMRRLDHAAIFLQIAGTYTPICVLAMPAPVGQRLLLLVWAGAALGIVKCVFWLNAPKPVMALLCVLMGWAVVGEWSSLRGALGPTGVALMIAGGVMYTLGAVVYARKAPDPLPRVFGYHEIFHLLVVLAAVCHFVLVWRLVAAT